VTACCDQSSAAGLLSNITTVVGQQISCSWVQFNEAEVLQLPQFAHQQCCSNMHRMCSRIVAVLALRLQLGSGASSCLSALVGVLQSAVVLHICTATFDSKQTVRACVFGSTASANSLSQIESLLRQPAVLCKAASAEV